MKAVAIGVVMALLPVAAASATEREWRPVMTTKLRYTDRLSRLVMAGPAPAWAFGTGSDLIAYRWDGRAWRRTPFPRGLDHGDSYLAGAAPDGGAWAVANSYYYDERRRAEPCDEDYEGYTDQSAALVRWTGRAWARDKVLKDTLVHGLAVFAKNNAWAFGQDLSGPVAWHFDGKSWHRKADPPITVTASASPSSADVWAIGYDRKGRQAIGRFDGRAWKLTRGALPKDVKPTRKAPGVTYGLNGISANEGLVQVTATRYQLSKADKCGEYDTDHENTTDLLVAGDGAHWTREEPEIARGWSLGDTTADGRGGGWVIGYRPMKGQRSVTALFHRNAQGAWTREDVPFTSPGPRIGDIELIPGTRSLLGAGAIYNDVDSDGVIAVKGGLG